MKERDLYLISGGGFNATTFNYISRFISTVFEIGQKVGSSIRRLFTKSFC